MASPIRLHWTKVVLALSVLAAVVLTAREAHAQRRKRVEIPECAQEDLYRSRGMNKEAKEWKPRCDTALKVEAAKPDTPHLAVGPLTSGRSQARPQPDLRVQQLQARAAQRAQQQQQARQEREAQRRAQAQAFQQHQALRQQQAQLARQRAEQQRQAQQLAQQRAQQQQLAFQQAQQQAALQRAQIRPPTAPPPAAPPPAEPAPAASAPAPAVLPNAQGTACFDAIQNKVAWDRDGKHTRWQPQNIAKLCTGAEDSIAPALCFAEAMRRDAQRQWPEAIAMCAGKR